jgi:DNA polymerase elongation subunit (family B)
LSRSSNAAERSERAPAPDPVLFGQNPEERILAVQHAGEGTMRVFRRAGGSVVRKEHEFYPFFFLTDSTLLEGFPQKHWIKRLDGSNDFRFLCAFTRWSDMWDAVNQVITRSNERTGAGVASYADLPSLHLRPDAVSQFLMQTGMTLFKGMEFDELHRMQLDIETYTARGSKFSNASRLEDRIILVALSDNRGWEEVVGNKQMTEDDLLKEVIGIIRRRDPDVIEGHNIYNFDLPYIMSRCRLRGIEFRVGRDGSPARSFESRSVFAERAFDTTVWDIAGRHIVDTWLLLQAYDASKRTLESYGLKQAARHFGFAREGREYVQPERISWSWDHEPERLIRYASDDAYETRMLAEYLSPTYFYLSTMLPFNYGTVARIGSSAKIESVMLREYIRRKHSIPRPAAGLQTTGGYADIYHTGILGPIVDVDVESLYPSIMLTERIGPKTETLGVFHRALESLTEMRINTKRKMQRSRDPVHRAKYDAMQSSFKILINSFYGYLGYTRALFSDPDAADRVTQTGQRMLRRLIAAIGEEGGTVVMVDTDGIFFVPPAGVRSDVEVDSFVAGLAATLPGGIRLAVNGRYSLIMSYKKKNYALLGEDGRVKIKGSSLTSRNVERFGRKYLRECIEALLRRDIAALHESYAHYHRGLTDHSLGVEEFARMETLKESLEQYAGAIEAGTRNKSANYEAAIASGNRWRAGDRISYYITGNDLNVRGFEHARLAAEWDPNFPDENVRYYLKRLDELSRKFEPFFTSADFRKIFSVDDLFPFSPEGIEILTQPVAASEGGKDEEAESAPSEPASWLDEG